VLMMFFQVLGVYPQLLHTFPDFLNQVFVFLSITNFDIQMFSPECSVQFGFWKKLFIKLCIPFFVFVLALCLVSLNKRCSNSKNKIRPADYLFQMIASISSAMFTLEVASFSEPFYCQKDDNGEYFMVSDSSVVCFDEKWSNQIVYVIGFGIFYLMLIPFILCWIVWNERKSILSDNPPEWIYPVIGGYRKDCYYWEIFVISRKFLLFLSSRFNRSTPSLALLILCIIQIFFLLCDMSVRPYTEDHLNNLNVL
jgi:hypothetical protein